MVALFMFCDSFAVPWGDGVFTRSRVWAMWGWHRRDGNDDDTRAVVRSDASTQEGTLADGELLEVRVSQIWDTSVNSVGLNRTESKSTGIKYFPGIEECQLDTTDSDASVFLSDTGFLKDSVASKRVAQLSCCVVPVPRVFVGGRASP